MDPLTTVRLGDLVLAADAAIADPPIGSRLTSSGMPSRTDPGSWACRAAAPAFGALEEASADGDADARLALDMFAGRAAAAIAAASTNLQRLDALVFTGGIGEHSHPMRQAICRRLAVLGVPIPAGPVNHADGVLATGPTVAVLRIGAREDIVVSREVARSRGLR